MPVMDAARIDRVPAGRFALLLLACGCGLALVAAPPLFAAAGWRQEPVLDALRWLLHPVCHQRPERSFHLWGEPLSVCHRCTGLYLGFALGTLAWPRLGALAARLAAKPRMIVLFFVPLAIDWALPNTAATRFGTGLVAGFPVALLPLLALAPRRGQAHANNRSDLR